jgi:hypothetical protein
MEITAIYRGSIQIRLEICQKYIAVVYIENMLTDLKLSLSQQIFDKSKTQKTLDPKSPQWTWSNVRKNHFTLLSL